MSRVSKTIRIWMIILVAIVLVRAALPYAGKWYINRVLRDKIEGYTGHIEDFDLALYRGAYQIQHLKLFKVSGKVKEPFVSIGEIDFSIAWPPLWQGHVVGSVKLDSASLNFVGGPTAETSQSGAEGKGWQDAIDSLFPLEIEELQIRRSQVRFLNPYSKPVVDLKLENLQLDVRNLGNTARKTDLLVSDIKATAKIQERGDLLLTGKLNMLRKPMSFDGSVSITKLEIPDFNDFFRVYANFNVKAGRLDLFGEAASNEGKVKGYVKPFLTNVDVLQVGEKFRGPVNFGSELLTSTLNLLVRRYSKDQVAVRIPFEGDLNSPKIPVWGVIKSMFGHAFGDGLKPKVEQSINIENVPQSQ